MKVSKDSWHYKVWRFTCSPPYKMSDNLCAYVQRIVLVAPLLVCMIIIFVAVVIAAILVMTPIFLLVLLVGLALGKRPDGKIRDLIADGVVPVQDAFWKRKEKVERKPAKPNIFWEYLKAKKAKVCPIIQFVDNESPEVVPAGEIVWGDGPFTPPEFIHREESKVTIAKFDPDQFELEEIVEQETCSHACGHKCSLSYEGREPEEPQEKK